MEQCFSFRFQNLVTVESYLLDGQMLMAVLRGGVDLREAVYFCTRELARKNFYFIQQLPYAETL